MSTPKPPATLSLDLDNQWAYMRVHGDPGWESFPSYLDRVVPRILALLADRRLRITFFIVGQDAVLTKNHDALAQIAAAGHEVASHSFHHLPTLAQGSLTEVHEELARAEEAIHHVTGQRVDGFRGPAFSLSQNLLEALRSRDYLYDASTFPTFIGPLARAFYKSTVAPGAPGEELRRNLYGGWKEGFRPLTPYRWKLQAGELLEIPITTFPGLRLPIHLTYLLQLCTVSRTAGLAYLRAALRCCRLTGAAPHLLLHPLDFLGGNDVPGLAFFPGMRMAGAQKAQIVADAVDILCADFAPSGLGDFARACLSQKQRVPARPFLARQADASLQSAAGARHD